MRFHHGRCIGQDHSHRVIFSDTRLLQTAGQLLAARIRLPPRLAQSTVHDGELLRVHQSCALYEAERRERCEVGGVMTQMLVKFTDHLPDLLAVVRSVVEALQKRLLSRNAARLQHQQIPACIPRSVYFFQSER